MKKAIHEGYICDVCDDNKPIHGIRYHCETCNSFDLCKNHFVELYKHHIMGHNWSEYRFAGGKIVKRPRTLHKGYTCDNCGCKPLRGIRFHCLDCEDFDVCENCYFYGIKSSNQVNHPSGHAFEPNFRPKKAGGKSGKKNPSRRRMKHVGVICDICDNDKPIIGPRYKCKDCADYDLCSKHYREATQTGSKIHTKGHKFLKISESFVTFIATDSIPYDVIGVIVTYLSVSKDYLNVCMVSKSVRRFLQVESTFFSRSIEFDLKKEIVRFKNVVMPYVYNLTIRDTPKFSDNFLLKRVPNVRKLRLIRVSRSNMTSRKAVKIPLPVFTNLEILDIDLVKGIRVSDLQKLTTVRNLRIDCSHDFKKPVAIGQWIGKFHRLENLTIVRCDLGTHADGFMKGLEEISGNIRKLVIINADKGHVNMNDVMLKMTNLEHLEMKGRVGVGPEAFQNTKKLRHLVLDQCSGTPGEEEFRKTDYFENVVFLKVVKYRRIRRGKMKRR